MYYIVVRSGGDRNSLDAINLPDLFLFAALFFGVVVQIVVAFDAAEFH
jgi:hypothetical protein